MMQTVSEALFDLIKEKLKRQNNLEMEVISGSMEPLIKTSEKILVSPFAAGVAPKRFDILVFWNGENLMCHYMWMQNQNDYGHNDKWIVTRPLAGKYEDFPIKENQILGYVINKKIPPLTKFKIFTHSIWKNI